MLSIARESWKIQTLFLTLVQISQCLYSEDVERCPKQILRFYNCCWLHHELSVDLFPNPHETALHGVYFHALLNHGPVQQEIINNRSVKTESEEQIFQKAKRCVRDTSNRKSDTLIPNLLIGLEAKEILYGSTSVTVHESDTRVKQAAQFLKQFSGTEVPLKYIRERPYSWQAHLERIAPFLTPGKGQWWDINQSESDIIFHDGDIHPNYIEKGPSLLHFRDSTLQDVVTQARGEWLQLLNGNVDIPSFEIKIYNEQGQVTETIPGHLLNVRGYGSHMDEMDICTNEEPDDCSTSPPKSNLEKALMYH